MLCLWRGNCGVWVLRRVFQICLQFPPNPAGNEDFDAVQREKHERACGKRGDKAAADYDRHPVCSVGVENECYQKNARNLRRRALGKTADTDGTGGNKKQIPRKIAAARAGKAGKSGTIASKYRKADSPHQQV